MTDNTQTFYNIHNTELLNYGSHTAHPVLDMIRKGVIAGHHNARELITSLLKHACDQKLDLTGSVFDQLDLSHKVIDMPKLGMNQCKIGAHFYNCILTSTSYTHTKLSYAIFNKSLLHNAKFHHAALHNANFSESNLTNSVFGGSDIQNACFEGADISNACFKDTISCHPKQFLLAKNTDSASFNADEQACAAFKQAIKELQRNQGLMGTIKSTINNLAAEHDIARLLVVDVLEPSLRKIKSATNLVKELFTKSVIKDATQPQSTALTKIHQAKPHDVARPTTYSAQTKPVIGHWTGKCSKTSSPKTAINKGDTSPAA